MRKLRLMRVDSCFFLVALCERGVRESQTRGRYLPAVAAGSRSGSNTCDYGRAARGCATVTMHQALLGSDVYSMERGCGAPQQNSHRHNQRLKEDRGSQAWPPVCWFSIDDAVQPKNGCVEKRPATFRNVFHVLGSTADDLMAQPCISCYTHGYFRMISVSG